MTIDENRFNEIVKICNSVESNYDEMSAFNQLDKLGVTKKEADEVVAIFNERKSAKAEELSKLEEKRKKIIDDLSKVFDNEDIDLAASEKVRLEATLSIIDDRINKNKPDELKIYVIDKYILNSAATKAYAEKELLLKEKVKDLTDILSEIAYLESFTGKRDKLKTLVIGLIRDNSEESKVDLSSFY